MIIVKNITDANYEITELGIVIQAHDNIDLLDAGVSFEEITMADSLSVGISSGSLIINDGDVDLSIPEALNQITIQTKHEDKTDSTPYQIPPGGFRGQRLVKNSDLDYDVDWSGEPISEDIKVPMQYTFKEKHWENGPQFTFDGTTLLGTPVSSQFLLNWECLHGTGHVRIKDLTNNKEVSRVSVRNESNESVYMIDSTLTNLPTGSAVFCVQGQVHNSKKDSIEITEVLLKFS